MEQRGTQAINCLRFRGGFYESISASLLSAVGDAYDDGVWDDAGKLRQIALRACDYVIALSEDENPHELRAEIEDRLLKISPKDTFFSPRLDKVISYAERVVQIEDEANELLFTLAGNKGETLNSLKHKTLGEILDFSKRIAQEKRGRH